MSEHDNHDEQENTPAPVSTVTERIWGGIFFVASLFCLFGIMYIDHVHGSQQLQSGFVIGFVGYFFGAGAILSRGHQGLFLDEEEKPQKPKKS
jgi:hypothetical protein